VPAGKGYLAYADADVEYAPGRWLLRPRDVGKLLQHLRPREGDKALAIAAPYAAAVLEKMGLQVTRLDGDDLTAVPGANYDVIICEGAVPRAPGQLDQGPGPGRPPGGDRARRPGRPRRDLRPGRGRRGPPRRFRRHPADAGRFRRRTGFAF
jgi:protein-L-isoaspartate O-methyltransferase